MMSSMTNKLPETPVQKTVDTIADADTQAETIRLSDDTEVTVYRCKMRHLGGLLSFVALVFDELKIKSLSSLNEETLKGILNDPTIILNLIAKCAGDVNPVAAQLCSLDLEKFKDLDVDDALLIIHAEWRLNQNFFFQRVLPMVNTILPTAVPAKQHKK